MIFNDLTLLGVVSTGKRKTIADTSRPGFVVLVSPFGKAHFAYRYKLPNGNKKVIQLGTEFEPALQAYLMYRIAQHKVASTSAAAAIMRTKEQDCMWLEGDLRSLADAWMVAHVIPNLSKHSHKNYRSFLSALIESMRHEPALVGQGTVEECRAPIKRYLREIRAKGLHISVKRHSSVYTTMFKWAEEEDLITRSPMYGMPKGTPGKPKGRKLNDSELRMWLPVMFNSKFEQHTTDGLYMVLLTGMRASELLNITPFDVDLKHDTLTLPVTKNGSEHLIALSPTSSAILERRMEGKSLHNRLFQTSVWGLRQVSVRNSYRANTTLVTTHDLRRTYATMCGMLRVQPHVVEALLNHKAQGVTRRHYNLYDYQEEKQEAGLKVDTYLTGLGLTI